MLGLRSHSNSLIPLLGISHKLLLEHVVLQARPCRPLLSEHEAVKSCMELQAYPMSLTARGHAA